MFVNVGATELGYGLNDGEPLQGVEGGTAATVVRPVIVPVGVMLLALCGVPCGEYPFRGETLLPLEYPVKKDTHVCVYVDFIFEKLLFQKIGPIKGKLLPLISEQDT